tara:strand:+ start:665 stop:766 length:102 start_codon:yes stop_codon:yes gene_type:complete
MKKSTQYLLDAIGLATLFLTLYFLAILVWSFQL